MAETAKVLNPDRIVVVPDRDAGCSLVESCPVEPVREFKRTHPDHVVVSYINTSIEVKAESDILCTSRNAVKIVNSIPRGEADAVPAGRQSGQLREAADRPREYEDLAGRLHRPRHVSRRAACWRRSWSIRTPRWSRIPSAPKSVLAMADFIGSTSALIEWCAKSDADGIHRDDGERRQLFPAARRAGQAVLLRGQRELQLHGVPVHEDEHARETARFACSTLQPRVEIPADIMRRALAPLERMLAVK